AIYIATPPGSHARYALRAAELGKPVYVEKPMARTWTECQEMVQAFEKEDLPLFVAYYRRALPMFLHIREQIRQGAIGTVRSVRIVMTKPLQPDLIARSETNWRVLPEIAGGGYFFDLAAHQLDYLDFLFGPIVEAGGMATNQAGQYPAEDIVSGYFRHESGVLGQGLWCFSGPEGAEQEETIITGSQGEIRYSTFGARRYRLYQSGRGWQDITTDPPPAHIQAPLIAQVIATLRGEGICPSTGKSAARTSWVMEQMVYG
ncbi:MAG: gfo/Idh/MocA family oxidoreductase, partial [Bacteroidetes bacterium]